MSMLRSLAQLIALVVRAWAMAELAKSLATNRLAVRVAVADIEPATTIAD
jgi:hypothetical protein